MRQLCMLTIACLLAISACAFAEKGKPPPPPKNLPPDTVVVRHDKLPKLISEVEPEFPRLAREGGFDGWVVIKAFVDTIGTVIAARAISTNRQHMGFEVSAVKAAYGYKYEPAQYKKKPVGVWVTYKLTFDTKKGKTRRSAIRSQKLD